MLAWDDTRVANFELPLGAAGLAAVSATFDFVFLSKDTEAYIGSNAQVDSRTNVEIRANSDEDVSSVAGSVSNRPT